MLPNSLNFIIYIEDLENLFVNNLNLNKLIDKYSINNVYFFTQKCNISIHSIQNYLKSLNINFNSSNIMTPTYMLINYCKTILDAFSIYPITDNNDLFDFKLQNINIDYKNPKIILVCTNKISKKDLNFIYNSNIPIVLSSNLCYNRQLNCSNCLKSCSIKMFSKTLKNRFIIPDIEPNYDFSRLFKQINIHPWHTAILCNSLRDDYIQYSRMGCKTILLLNDNYKLKTYLDSPHDIDIVVENFDKLMYLLNL